MEDVAMNDPVSSAVQEVVDLFTKELTHLRFGDLEAGVLAASADEVKAVAVEVAEAEAVLDGVRARLAEKQDALIQKAQRALAYARVYAEGQPDLAARIEQIALPRGARRAARVDAVPAPSDEMQAAAAGGAALRRRGRPRRIEPESTLLALPDETALDPAMSG
jgi:ElaB/YqjD/DUF883 family membrane-anchored ribosome-binding protein